MRFPNGQVRKLRRSSEVPGSAHELTFSCYRRLPLLGRDDTRRWLIEAIWATANGHQLELWAYVIMPEHVHLLFVPRDPQYRLSRILQSIKQPVMRRAINFLKQHDPARLTQLEETGRGHGLAEPDRATRVERGHGRGEPDRATPRYHFWQPGGGYDRNVAIAKTAWSVVQYIHVNPVRRGLAERPTDWVWSSARWYAGEAKVVLEMDGVPPDP